MVNEHPLEINGQIIKERRKNGARLKLSSADWIKITSFAVFVIFSYAGITFAVNNNSQINKKQESDIKLNNDRSIENKQVVIGLQKDVQVIQKDVKEILRLIK